MKPAVATFGALLFTTAALPFSVLAEEPYSAPVLPDYTQISAANPATTLDALPPAPGGELTAPALPVAATSSEMPAAPALPVMDDAASVPAVPAVSEMPVAAPVLPDASAAVPTPTITEAVTPPAAPALPDAAALLKNSAEPETAKTTEPAPATLSLKDLLKPEELTEQDLAPEKPQEQKADKAKKEATPQKIAMRDVKFTKYRLPDTIYTSSYSKDNNHLPVVRFESDYDAMLFKAAGEGDLMALRALVDTAKRNIEMRNSEGETPLLYAARLGEVNSVRFLLSRKADADSYSDTGFSALHYAAYNDHSTLVTALLAGHANPNALDSKGISPLVYAVERGNLEVARSLLQYGAEPNVLTNDGRTALTFAAERAHDAMTDLLISYGADAALASAPAASDITPVQQGNVIYYDSEGNELKPQTR